MTRTEMILDAVRHDTSGMVGPVYRATRDGNTIIFAVAAPDSLKAILDSGEDGRTWTEHGTLYGTCAVCHLERPTTSMTPVDGRWYCPDDPRCRP